MNEMSRKTQRNKSQGGFTLIELMIVVAIIGILAALAIPRYQDYTVRTRVSEGLNLAQPIRTAVAEYYSSTNEWPSAASAGYPTAEDFATENVTSIGLSGGGETPNVITIVYSAASGSISLLASASAQTVSWICGTDIKLSQVPANCRNTLTAPAGT